MVMFGIESWMGVLPCSAQPMPNCPQHDQGWETCVDRLGANCMSVESYSPHEVTLSLHLCREALMITPCCP